VKRKPRILLIDIGAPFGGVETYIESLCALFRTECEMFCVCALPELAVRLNPLGVHVVCIPITFNRWCKILRFLLAVPILFYLIVRYRVQVVQVNGYLESLLVLPARLLGCRTIRTAHGPSELDRYRWYQRPEMFLPRLASQYCLRLASGVVCVSEAVSQDVRRVVPPSRISVVANWVSSIPDHVPNRAVLHSPVRILYVGRLEEYKGLDLLFDAVKEIPNVQIIVVGQGSYRSQLERTADGLCVTFEGFQPDTSTYYRDADIFVNPSRGPEGLPLVSLEAMAQGTPCLFSDLPVHREISESGRAASLFRSGEMKDLRQRLQNLLSDDQYRQGVAAAARGVISAKYSSQAALQGYRKAFDLA
jgi:glycosyltransferase involved in cell wall biosynthesis